MILAIGYRVRSIRGVQFRQWATRHLSEYLVKGFTMDDDRLKNSDGCQRPQASRRSPCGSVDRNAYDTPPFAFALCRSPCGSICKCDVLCICHNVACMGCLLTKWKVGFLGFLFQFRGSYCTFGVVCAGISSVLGSFSPSESSWRGLLAAFCVQNCRPDDSAVCSDGHENWGGRRWFSVEMNGWLSGRIRLHPGLQTLATAVAYICVQSGIRYL